MLQPLQQRSEASLGRLLEAANRLVRRDGFHGSSINRICAEAGLTSGAFYARFSSKEDLALPLWEQIERQVGPIVEEFSTSLARTSISESVRGLIVEILKLYRRDGDLLRELISLASRKQELANAMRQANEQALQRLVGVVIDSRTAISHPNPRLAVTLGLICVLNTLRELALERTIFKTSSAISVDILADEMTRLFVSYLRS